MSNENLRIYVNDSEILHLVIKSGNEKLTEKLLTQDNANIPHNGLTPLLMAAINNRHSIAKLLLDPGADVNFCNEYNEAPLMAAVSNSNIELILLLLPGKNTINNSYAYKLTCL